MTDAYRENAAGADQQRPYLIRGGTVVSVDAKTGTLARGDVLVVDGCIAAVGEKLDAPTDAEIIDADGHIVMPGLVDAHRHTWEAVVRGLGADWSLVDYFKLMPVEFGQFFEPEDIYAANLLVSIENINDGVTTIGDWADNAGRSPEYADAAIRGLVDGGVRGRLHYANLFGPAQDWGATPELDRLWARYGDRNGRVSMQMGIDSTRDPAFPEQVALRFAKERGIPVATHAGAFGWDHDAWIGRLHEHDLMGIEYTYIHVVAAPDRFVDMIAETGGAVTMASCSNCHYGQGFPVTAPIRKRGIPVGLGSDYEMRARMSVHEVMRGALMVDNLHQHLCAHEGGHVAPILELRTDGVLKMGTSGGARALGLQDVTGSLTPGKQADIVIVEPDPDTMPYRWNPEAHIIYQGGADRVRTVLVGGRIVKQNGMLVGYDLDKARSLVTRTRDRLIEAIGEPRLREVMNRSASDPDEPPPPTL